MSATRKARLWGAAWTVVRKELVESLRDRRSLLYTLLVGPMLAPAVFALIIHATVAREIARADAPLPLPVAGGERAPGLVRFLREQGALVTPAPADPELAVRTQKADVVLRIPDDYEAAWYRGDPAPVEIVYDASQRDAAGPLARVRAMLDAYGRQLSTERLLARGIPPSVLLPIRPIAQDESTAQSRSGTLFGLLPYFFILSAFVGGMAVAIDATAGERERQSLEPLLSSRAPRTALVLGKVAATASLSGASVAVSLALTAALAPTLPVARLGMALNMGPGFVVEAIAVLVPVVALLAVLQNAVSAFARSYREAQTYLSLLMFVPSLPAMVAAVVPVKAGSALFLIPIIGQQLAVFKLLRGDPPNLLELAILAVFTSGLAVVGIMATIARYRSDKIFT